MKNLKNLGVALSKAEQKTINGGGRYCETHNDCPPSDGCCARENICMSAIIYYESC